MIKIITQRAAQQIELPVVPEAFSLRSKTGLCPESYSAR